MCITRKKRKYYIQHIKSGKFLKSMYKENGRIYRFELVDNLIEQEYHNWEDQAWYHLNKFIDIVNSKIDIKEVEFALGYKVKVSKNKPIDRKDFKIRSKTFTEFIKGANYTGD